MAGFCIATQRVYCNWVGWVIVSRYNEIVSWQGQLEELLESCVAIQCIVLQQAARLERKPVSQYKPIVLWQA